MAKKGNPPTYEEFKAAVIESCKWDFTDRLAAALKTEKAEDYIRSGYKNACAMLSDNEITVKQFLEYCANTTAGNLWMSFA